MSDSTTPNLGLIKPVVGGSDTTWGTKWNTNADDLDSHYASMLASITTLQSQVATLQSQMGSVYGQFTGAPIGAIFPWMMFSGAPGGYLNCDGTAVAIATYPALYAILGTRYGGDGVSTFGKPDLRGCVLSGYDGGTGRLGGLVEPDQPGAIGGAPYIALNASQMPSHQHAGSTDGQGQHTHGYQQVGIPPAFFGAFGQGFTIQNVGAQTDPAGFHAHNIATDFQGGGAGHPNLQVTALVMWIIRAI